MRIKCNKCGYTADESEFPKGRDFFQNPFVSDCPKCDNHQDQGDASIWSFRLKGSRRPPFEYVPEPIEGTDG